MTTTTPRYRAYVSAPDCGVLIGGEVQCAYCGEGKGWCELTGGPNPCEGLGEFAEDLAEYAAAPTVTFPSGGSSVD